LGGKCYIPARWKSRPGQPGAHLPARVEWKGSLGAKWWGVKAFLNITNRRKFQKSLDTAGPGHVYSIK